MGFFDFFRRKKEKPAEQKADPKLEPVKDNRTDRPFEFEKRREDSPFRKGPRRNYKRKRKSTDLKESAKQPGQNVRALNQRPAKKHYTPQQTAPDQPMRNYTVKAGDSLSRIAKEFYGNANDWQKIYQANKSRIKDPNIIHPGQKLLIP
jgi:nucleoid-associated protein YgaU